MRPLKPFTALRLILVVWLLFSAVVTLAVGYQAAVLAQGRLSLAHTLLSRTDLGPAAEFAAISLEGICEESLREKEDPNKPLWKTTSGAVRRFCTLREMDRREVSIEDFLSFIADLFVFFGIAIESLTMLSPTWRDLLRQGGQSCEPIEVVAGHAGLVALLFGIAVEIVLVYWRPFGGFDTYRIVASVPEFADWRIPYVVLALLALPWGYLLTRALFVKPLTKPDLFEDWTVL